MKIPKKLRKNSEFMEKYNELLKSYYELPEIGTELSFEIGEIITTYHKMFKILKFKNKKINDLKLATLENVINGFKIKGIITGVHFDGTECYIKMEVDDNGKTRECLIAR